MDTGISVFRSYILSWPWPSSFVRRQCRKILFLTSLFYARMSSCIEIWMLRYMSIPFYFIFVVKMFTQKKVAGFGQFIVSHYEGDKTFSGASTTVFFLKTKKTYDEFVGRLQKVYNFHYAQAYLKDYVAQWKATYVYAYSFEWTWKDCKLKVNWKLHKMKFNYNLETYK